MINGYIFNKTRIAPTPSGYLHLGNIYSFAITAALARNTGAKILLRIDDFDRERTNMACVQDIFDTLNFLEIPWDEGPRNRLEYEQQYSQAHRMGLYNSALRQLRESGHLFACTCSRADVLKLNSDSIYTGTCREKNISLDAKNVSWRIRTNDTDELAVKTLDGVKATFPKEMKDFIVRKKDGFPAYQLISVIDDIHYGVDLVVRGDDLWPSTLAQIYLSSFLETNTFPDTTFYHHPLINDDKGLKLSKSEGATSVYYLRKQNKKPADVYKLIAQALDLQGDPGSWEELVKLLHFTDQPATLSSPHKSL